MHLSCGSDEYTSTSECIISRGSSSRRQNGFFKTQFRETKTKTKSKTTTTTLVSNIVNKNSKNFEEILCPDFIKPSMLWTNMFDILHLMFLFLDLEEQIYLNFCYIVFITWKFFFVIVLTYLFLRVALDVLELTM